MESLEKIIDSQTSISQAEICKAALREGLNVGQTFGEILNGWIDKLYDSIKTK